MPILKPLLDELKADIKLALTIVERVNRQIDSIVLTEIELKESEIEQHIKTCKKINDGDPYIHVTTQGKYYFMKQFAKGQIMEYNALAVHETRENIETRRALLIELYHLKNKPNDMPNM